MNPSYSIKYSRFLNWRTSNLREEDGVIVGADISQEWLLPWWWKNYRKHNSHPVAFVDFGMSFEKKDWCRERGEFISLRIFDDFVAEKNDIAPENVHLWETDIGTFFWGCRSAWFKKPLAFLQTPFRRSLWLDLDCEIRNSIQKLFEYADSKSGIGLVHDFDNILSDLSYPMYNSGVVPYRRNLPLIIEWARNCLEKNADFSGDQEVLSHMIAMKKIAIAEMPRIYNWSRLQEETGEEIIVHWHGNHGKRVIQSQINLEELSF